MSSFSGENGWGVFVILLVIAGLLYAAFRMRSEPRLRAGAAVGARLRLRHSRGDAFGLRNLPFSIFHRVQPPVRLTNVLSGAWRGMDVKAFEIASVGGSVVAEEGTKPMAFSCALLPFPAGWPAIRVERETLASLLADALGVPDLDFESEAFDRAFEVWSPDPRFANALIDARMMEWLLSLPTPWGFEAAGGMLLGYTGLRQPWEVEDVLSTAAGFLEHAPQVVYSLYPPGSAQGG